jgi:hypothetical protein
MHKQFKSPDKHFIEGQFKTTKKPKTPNPKNKNYYQLALKKDDYISKCSYIHSDGKRCKLKLGLYPTYCHLHTMLIENVYISKSQIEKAGNGLFAGPYGFKKGNIIGKYSNKSNSAKLGEIKNRCKNDKCWSYVFCDIGHTDNTMCWDGLDIRSTIMRNINDAHKSKFRNNSYFDILDGEVYVIASKDIKPLTEIFVNYGKIYW